MANSSTSLVAQWYPYLVVKLSALNSATDIAQTCIANHLGVIYQETLCVASVHEFHLQCQIENRLWRKGIWLRSFKFLGFLKLKKKWNRHNACWQGIKGRRLIPSGSIMVREQIQYLFSSAYMTLKCKSHIWFKRSSISRLCNYRESTMELHAQ
jgi:hypothetical protein